MADKDNLNDDKDEREDQFDDDEDFGLPDLEYDELDDDLEEDSADDATSVFEEKSNAASGDELYIDEKELAGVSDSGESEDWEKELEKELEAELKEAESAGFYEEESFEEFEESVESGKLGVTSEAPRAPEPVPAPAKPVAEEKPKAAPVTPKPVQTPPKPAYKPTYAAPSKSASKGKFVRTVVIGTIGLVIVASVFLYVSSLEPKKPEPKVVEKVEPKPEPKPEPQPEPQPEPVKKPVAKPGEITTLSEQTGKTYIVISSFFDGDIAMDHAQKLAKDGKSPLIIPPFKDYRFYRVAIAEFDNFKDAQASLPQFKEEFGADVWPLRY